MIAVENSDTITEKQEEINGANTYENTGNFYTEITSPLDGSEYELNPNKDR